MKPDPRGKPDFTICDPACGTGGFLVCAYEWLDRRDQGRRVRPRRSPSASRPTTYFGQDLVPRPRRLALMNLFLHGVEPHITLGDTIYEPDRGDRFDVRPHQSALRHEGREPGARPRRLHHRDQQQAAQLRPARPDHPEARRPRRDGAAGQLPVRGQGRRGLRDPHAGLQPAHRPAPAARHVHALQPGRESQRHLLPEGPTHGERLDFRRALQRARHHQERPPAHPGSTSPSSKNATAQTRTAEQAQRPGAKQGRFRTLPHQRDQGARATSSTSPGSRTTRSKTPTTCPNRRTSPPKPSRNSKRWWMTCARFVALVETNGNDEA